MILFLLLSVTPAEEPIDYHAPEHTIELMKQLAEYKRALHRAAAHVAFTSTQCEALRGEYLLLQDDSLRQPTVDMPTVEGQARRVGKAYQEALIRFDVAHDQVHRAVDDLVVTGLYTLSADDLNHILPTTGQVFPRNGVHYSSAFASCP